MWPASEEARRYVDPWDLDNYDYLMGGASTDDSDFYFVRPHSRTPSTRYDEFAAVDEEDFYNEQLSWRRQRRRSVLGDEDDYCYYSGSGSSFSSEAPPYPASPQLPPPQCELYSPSVLTRRTVRKGAAPQLVYVYETGRGRRKMALPKEQPMGNTPPFIPSMDYDVYGPGGGRFCISGQGLLRMDYSSSWKVLGRYIDAAR